MKKVISFHIKNGYYVKVKPVPNIAGCFVTFPTNLIYSLGELSKTYIINRDRYEIEVYELEKKEKIHSKVIHADKYNVRLLIIQDILLKTLLRNMSKSLIVAEGEKTIFDMLSISLDKEDAEIEKVLCLKFSSLLEGEIEHDIDSKIKSSYLQLLKFFESGGF